MYDEFVELVRSLYPCEIFIPLHRPLFSGNEKKYLCETIDSTFVSSVGEFVNRFERSIADFTNAKFAVATVNGTSALHIALLLAGVKQGDEVITQPVTFVATCNAITYCGAVPVFVDIERETMGMNPEALKEFLDNNTFIEKNSCYNKVSGSKISAIVPMHTLGHPCRIDKIVEVATQYGIPVVEDAAESLGSYYKGKHTGTFGDIGVLSFNGNKVITTGGGGMILVDSEVLAKQAKHLTTTAKVENSIDFEHDMTGFNYRLPNINAALGCAQLENITFMLEKKRLLAERYRQYFISSDIEFLCEPAESKSNFWINSVIFPTEVMANDFIAKMGLNKIGVRPMWRLMNTLRMFENCQTDSLEVSTSLNSRIVSLPSSVQI
ncbi:MAG: LegC family aminotransferase [Gammaproteobacteria bacterium]|nr:LegC family aminotransferase [Gammaproteobacteria bacterium]MDH5691805.1 LegC family aminotransferase [Gammaproteobacteria bacterium]